ncbi:hypothetical protein AQB9606_03047 [Aquabacterium sp. CECT 9606]|nr:hypothetical protein AQB9606_03047 [Aquabacterium sp. CECT 9606]
MWRSLAIDASTGFAYVGAASFVGQAFRVLQSTDLTGFAGHNLAARPSLNLAVCPAAACSPPLFANAPHAIASSRAVLRRPRFTTRSLQANAQTITAYCLAKVTLNIQATAGHCLQQSGGTMAKQLQGAAMRFAIKFTARVSGLNPSSTSRPSLTVRSIRHPQAPLVGTLRASHSGAAYLGR